MTEINEIIRAGFELGVLGTGRHAFYERLGWHRWHGPSYVRTPAGLERTPEDDGYLLVLRAQTTPTLDTSSRISCEWRPGDVW
jgi:aminoglycoside 2'-N-acetyltransferase I